jgi:hypothetical protein
MRKISPCGVFADGFYLRHYRRVSNADADLQGKVLAYHDGPQKSVVRHFLTINRPSAA